MGSLPTHSKPSKLIPMRKLTATICLTIAVLLGSEVRGSDFQKGAAAAQSGDFATALREWKHLAENGDTDAQTSRGVMYYIGKGGHTRFGLCPYVVKSWCF
jgi:hypothetical protein